jgi:hypothetical protein
LGAVAYLGTNDLTDPCLNYLGDSGETGLLPFSFRVPAGSNFVVNVQARTTNANCGIHTLEIFGLPCPPPRLHLVKDSAPGKVLARWSTAYPAYRLQSTNTLPAQGPSGFSEFNTTPVVAEGKYTVTNATAAPKQFFRLAKWVPRLSVPGFNPILWLASTLIFVGRQAMLELMRIPAVVLLCIVGLSLSLLPAEAQYKAPSQYFRKDSPKPNPGAPSGTPTKPELAAKPKFKELPVNTQFYFVTDTNRQFPWMKLSESSAKNTKNGVTQTLSGETPIQR